ncbi:MAG TPA: cysteine--tRNA ligase, partial [Lachnospiraceae bacterium]|nr:cysteine--tRNA ligase [Lachnospiraceae bacterium]
RPGWHLECSVMSKKYIGGTIDIHAGGEDLIFPHHENEIAQSEAANDAEFARYWMHNGFLRINNEKMSKSLGNFFTVREICEKYDPQVVRFFMLSAQYRSPLNFSEDLIIAAKNGLERILTSAEKLRDVIANAAAPAELQAGEQEVIDGIKPYVEKFEAAMDDDLNTADAVSVIFEYVKYVNTNVNSASSKALAEALYKELSVLAEVLGIILEKKDDDLDSEVEALIAERQQARKDKNFAKADEIRDKLLAMGIELKDTREGVKWKRI